MFSITNTHSNMEKPININPSILYAIELLSENKEHNQDKALDIIKSVISNYDKDIYPDYSQGLAGIGYGIQYMINNGYIKGNADEILKNFDKYLFSNVHFYLHTDLSHTTGLVGIASYFMARLEDKNASDNNIQTLICKSVILTIIDIISARLNINGYTYPIFNGLKSLNQTEKKDIRDFVISTMKYNICNCLSNKILHNIQFCLTQEEKVYEGDSGDLSDMTIIIPIRIDSGERRENLNTVVQLYLEQTKAQIIILEADSIPHVHMDSTNRVRYYFYEDTNPIFHHTHYRNELIKLTNTNIIAVWDADIIVPLEQLHKSVIDIKKNNIIFSTPYDGICYNVPNNISDRFRTNLNMNELECMKNRMHNFFGALTIGGVFLVEREKYIEIGMENEFFVGWGPEDIERLKRITILDLPVSRISGSIYHLYHPRKLNSSYANSDHNIKAHQELLHICQMSKTELLKYIQSWKWRNTSNSKFRKKHR